MKKITTWAAWDKKKNRFCHNHIESGWILDLKPEPKFTSQNGWNNLEWERKHCYLSHSQVVLDKIKEERNIKA